MPSPSRVTFSLSVLGGRRDGVVERYFCVCCVQVVSKDMWQDMYRFHSLEGRTCRPVQDVQQYQSVPDMHQLEDLDDDDDDADESG